MNPVFKNSLRVMRKLYVKGFLKESNLVTGDGSLMPAEQANELIYQGLMSSSPFMVARFGAVELSCVANYRSVSNRSVEAYWKYISRQDEACWWDQGIMDTMVLTAGFFPSTVPLFERFARMMMEDIKELDILGSWLWQEKLIEKELAHVQKVTFSDLEPYHHSRPWSRALAGKKVLVVHPFADSIASQYYERRELLFADREVLPEFELLTLKAVQSAAGTETGFKDWFEALDYMKQEVSSRDFDIAILGCGAYGFPLAAHIKRLGKKAIHLGGATQLLFGIIGRRWQVGKDHQRISSMMNEHWVRPLALETPAVSHKMENGAYW